VNRGQKRKARLSEQASADTKNTKAKDRKKACAPTNQIRNASEGGLGHFDRRWGGND